MSNRANNLGLTTDGYSNTDEPIIVATATDSSETYINERKAKADSEEEVEDDNYIFRLVTNTVSPIKHLIELLRDLLTEGVLECTKKGIRLYKINQDKTCIVHMRLQADKFEEYYCKRPIFLPLRMDSLFRVIKLVESGEVLTMFVTEEDEHCLIVERMNTMERFRNSKCIRTITSTEESIVISNISYKNTIKMTSSRFQKICKELSQFGNYVSITSTADMLSFKTNDDGDNFIPQEIMFMPTENNLGITYEGNDCGTVEGIFNLKHMLQFSKCANLTENVMILLQNDEMMTIQSNIMDMGEIKICLVPILHASDDYI